jgi:hypothetical protein
MVWEEISEKEVDVIKNNQSVYRAFYLHPWGTDWNRLVVFGILTKELKMIYPKIAVLIPARNEKSR